MPLSLGSFIDQMDTKTSGSITYVNIAALPTLDAQGVIEEMRRFNTDSSCQYISSTLSAGNQMCIFFVSHNGQPDAPEHQFGESLCFALEYELELLVHSAALLDGVIDNEIVDSLRRQLTTQISGRTVWGKTYAERFSSLLGAIRAGGIRATITKYALDASRLAETERDYEDRLLKLCGLSEFQQPKETDFESAVQIIFRYALLVSTSYRQFLVMA